MLKENDNPPLIIYHGNCLDGFTAAWSIWLKHPDWEFYPATHGHAPPEIEAGRQVYMVDFSYKLPVIRELLKKGIKLTIIDHHHTAEADLNGLFDVGDIDGVFDMKHSGAYLTWQWFHGKDKEVPLFIRLVEDRDLWKWEVPNSKEANAFFFSFPYHFGVWNNFLHVCNTPHQLEDLVKQGDAINRKQAKDITELISNCAMKVKIGGHTVWCANLPYTLASEAAHQMCYDDKTFAAAYYVDKDWNYVFSLRSRSDGMDVSKIALLYGGGGHKNASGFRIRNLEDLDYALV
jgi:uncharacterized protein